MSRVRPQRRRDLSVLSWLGRVVRVMRVRVARRVDRRESVMVLGLVVGVVVVGVGGEGGRKPGAELQYRLSVGSRRTAANRIWPSMRRRKDRTRGPPRRARRSETSARSKVRREGDRRARMETQWDEPTSAGWSLRAGTVWCVRRKTNGQRTISLRLVNWFIVFDRGCVDLGSLRDVAPVGGDYAFG